MRPGNPSRSLRRSANLIRSTRRLVQPRPVRWTGPRRPRSDVPYSSRDTARPNNTSREVKHLLFHFSRPTTDIHGLIACMYASNQSSQGQQGGSRKFGFWVGQADLVGSAVRLGSFRFPETPTPETPTLTLPRKGGGNKTPTNEGFYSFPPPLRGRVRVGGGFRKRHGDQLSLPNTPG
jgi:hypothetical protein